MMYTVQITCPIHALQPLLVGAGVGARPFAGISAAAALGVLRAILSKLEVANASEYRCHDLRRGHARDLQMSGKPLHLCACAVVGLVVCKALRFMKSSPPGSGDPRLSWTT